MNINLDQYKPKIYIAYKSETSRYLAYIIYKMLISGNQYQIFYDKAKICAFELWEEKLNANIDQCDLLLIIGEKGAFDSLKVDSKNSRDFFIKEMNTGLKKNKLVFYLAIDGYVFWEHLYSQTENTKGLRIKHIKRLTARQICSIDFEKKSIDEFERSLEKFKKDLSDFIDKQYKESIPIGSILSNHSIEKYKHMEKLIDPNKKELEEFKRIEEMFNQFKKRYYQNEND